MTNYIQDSLIDGEQLLQQFKIHWSAMIPVWLFALASPVTLGVTLIPATIIWLKLRTTEHGLTQHRIISKRGIIARRTQEMRSQAVETVEINQSLWGRIFGAGTVKITGQGLSDVVFDNIDNPLIVKKLIEQSLARCDSDH